MSLAIDTDTVVAVLLADGWHEVEGRSFDLDAYEFMEPAEERRPPFLPREPHLIHGGGTSGVCATGFVFRDAKGGLRLCGPLTAILAVRLADAATRLLPHHRSPTSKRATMQPAP